MREPTRKITISVPAKLHPSTRRLVREFATAMAEKLRAAEQKHGYSTDWKRDSWRSELREELFRHVAKGDPLDVANYCAFAWARGWTTCGRDS